LFFSRRSGRAFARFNPVGHGDVKQTSWDERPSVIGVPFIFPVPPEEEGTKDFVGDGDDSAHGAG
jgi:hypothetical protein